MWAAVKVHHTPDVRQLAALATVVERGSFGAAAQAMSLTLAPASLRIKALEESLGQRLLVRGKQVRATSAGQALLGHVKQLRMMEADLLGGLLGTSARSARRWQSLSVAVNADSVAILAGCSAHAAAPLLAARNSDR